MRCFNKQHQASKPDYPGGGKRRRLWGRKYESDHIKDMHGVFERTVTFAQNLRREHSGTYTRMSSRRQAV